MKHHPRLFEVLERSETGPIVNEVDFDRKLIGPTIKRLLSKYYILYTSEFYVNLDNDLADRVFHAGLDFASEVGVFNQSTSRRITWTRDEIIDALRTCPAEASVGAGEQRCTVVARKPEDTNRIALVGKPGTPFGAVQLSPTAFGSLAGVTWGGLRTYDHNHVPMTSEFKINNDLLAIITHAHNHSGFIGAYYNPIYGGFVGGAEGIAIAVAAGMILLNQVTIGHTFCTRPTHPFLGCDTTPEILWATSLADQALTRNSNLMIANLAGPVSGPGTRTILYENAAFALMAVASGVSELEASHSAGGAVPRHGSGLDARICAEVARTMPGFTRQHANELVSRLVHLYQPEMKKKPIGKPFEQVYDVENIEPTAEWQNIYDEVKEELIAMGIPLDQFDN